MHKLLQRQLRRHMHLGPSDPLPEECSDMLEAVDQAYEQADVDRHLLERSLDLTSKELIERNEDLVRSNYDLEQFAYVASHNLQEPLRMVASYTQFLARRYKGKLDATADEFIGYAVEGATRMQQLIEGLLVYSRVGTRGRAFEQANCQIVLKGVLTNLQLMVKETGAVVTHDYLPTVKADTLQLSQVFQNLIANAIKFRQRNASPHIHISAARKDNAWVFSVRDDGIGLDAKHADRIFLIYQRLHTQEEYEGTGIGLALCKKTVERHGGQIWVESMPGQGATFYFSLPMDQSQDGNADA